MHLKSPFLRVIGLILLPVVILFGRLSPLTADPETGVPAHTALGDPLQTSAPAAEEKASSALEETASLNPATLDTFTYLPLIANTLLGAEAQAVVDLVNAERALAGCDPLRVSAQLVRAAQGHSQDMALLDFFSHTSLDGRSPWDRIHATGYVYSYAAENIAAGYTTAASAVNGWMNSSGHRANILNCRLEETGVGYYYLADDTGQVNYHHYWTQVFATPR